MSQKHLKLFQCDRTCSSCGLPNALIIIENQVYLNILFNVLSDLYGLLITTIHVFLSGRFPIIRRPWRLHTINNHDRKVTL